MPILSWYLLIAGIFNTVSAFFLGILVFAKNPRGQANRSYAVLCASFGFYSIFYALIFSEYSLSKENCLLFFQLASAGSFFMPVSYFHFVSDFLKARQKKIIIAGYVSSAILAMFAFSRWFIIDLVPKSVFEYWAEPGPVFHLSVVSAFFYSFFSFYLLAREYLKARGLFRLQIRYILIGTFISTVAALSNFTLWYDINIPPFLAILMSTYIYFSAYTIIAHHLLDIRIILKKSTVNVLAFCVIVLFILPFKYLGAGLLSPISAWLDYLIILAAISVFPFVKTKSFEFANRYLFSSSYIIQDVISDLSYKLRTTLDRKLLYEYIFDTLEEALHFRAFAIYGYSEGSYELSFSRGIGLECLPQLEKNEFLQKYYIKKNKPIVADELKNSDNKQARKFEFFMEKNSIKVIFPLNIKYRAIGLLVFGEKESHSIYNKEDLRLLGISSGLAAAAIENSNLYHRLKKNNQDLENMLKMKGEFLRVINHQLNTPVSIMRMGFSSYREKIMPIEKSIAMAEAGLNRISATLSDFWEAYNLEGEKIRMDLKDFDLAGLVRQEAENAKIPPGHYLKVRFLNKAGEKLTVRADEARIRHVVSHLLMNAVSYTKEGEVVVSLEESDYQGRPGVIIKVKDTGIGIPEEDKAIIFDKFTRGSKAPLVHPDGSGLGLYIAKKVAEGHGGELRIEKTGENKGTVFTFQIPRLAPDSRQSDERLKQDIKNHKAPAKKKSYKGKKVLFIDGEQGIVDIFKDYFQNFGIKFFSSTDTGEILDIIKKEKIDMVYLEIVIPKKTQGGSVNVFTEQGWSILKAIKSDAEASQARVAVFTGLDSTKDKERALSAGAYKFISKSRARPSDLLHLLN